VKPTVGRDPVIHEVQSRYGHMVDAIATTYSAVAVGLECDRCSDRIEVDLDDIPQKEHVSVLDAVNDLARRNGWFLHVDDYGIDACPWCQL